MDWINRMSSISRARSICGSAIHSEANTVNTSHLKHWGLLLLAAAGAGSLVLADTPPAPNQAFSLNDIPKEFNNKFDNQDFTKREEMIPMRDGVKLHTILYVPKSAHGAPMILTRTPYNAAAATRSASSTLFN